MKGKSCTEPSTQASMTITNTFEMVSMAKGNIYDSDRLAPETWDP